MNQVQNSYSAIILAGGKSSRMGSPKAWLKINEEHTFLEKIVLTFSQFGITDILVILNNEFAGSEWKDELERVKTNAKVITNNEPELGRLYSLQLGLKSVKNKNVFIHNVDSPFVEQDVLHQLLSNQEENGVSIPSYHNKGGHPVLISSIVKQEITSNYTKYNTLKELLSGFTRKHIEVESKSILMNINTAQDFEKHVYESV